MLPLKSLPFFSLQKSKRIIKRFAHWDWDKNTKTDNLKDISEQLKVDLFTKASENMTKKRLESWNGEKILKKQIRNKWMKDSVDLNYEMKNFGKFFKEPVQTHRKISVKTERVNKK